VLICQLLNLLLLEMILLVAELENLQADLNKPATGVIIESSLDQKRGPSATIIIQDGILQTGVFIATPAATGKIKSIEDFRGKRLERALPSQPAVVIGFETLPIIGEMFHVAQNADEAKQFVLKQQTMQKPQPQAVVKEGKKTLKHCFEN